MNCMRYAVALTLALLTLAVQWASAQDRGKPLKLERLIITFWSAPPVTGEALAAVAAEGYNMTWAPASGLDAAAAHGLKVMLQEGLLDPQALEHTDLQQRLDELIARVHKHPALECYFIADEPSAAAFPALARLVAYLHEKDPDHYAYINLFPSYADNAQLGTKGDTVTAYREHLRRFIEIVKPTVLSYDHYHFLKSGDGGYYFLNLGLIREAALQAHIPFMNIVQASHGLSIWRPVSADELRWLVYTTLAYGGRGLS